MIYRDFLYRRNTNQYQVIASDGAMYWYVPACTYSFKKFRVIWLGGVTNNWLLKLYVVPGISPSVQSMFKFLASNIM